MLRAGKGNDPSFGSDPMLFSRNNSFHLSSLNTYLPPCAIVRLSVDGLSCLNRVFEGCMGFNKACNLENLISDIANDAQFPVLEGGEKSQAIIGEIRKLSPSLNSTGGVEYVTWVEFEHRLFSTKTNLRRSSNSFLKMPLMSFSKEMDNAYAERSEYRQKLQQSVGNEYSFPVETSTVALVRPPPLSPLSGVKQFIATSKATTLSSQPSSNASRLDAMRAEAEMFATAAAPKATAVVGVVSTHNNVLMNESAIQVKYEENVQESQTGHASYEGYQMDIEVDSDQLAQQYISNQISVRLDQGAITSAERSSMNKLFATRTNVEEVIITKFDIPMTRRLLHALAPSKWLNDEVINFYMLLLQQSTDLWVRRVKDHHTTSPNDPPLCIGEQFQRRSYFFSSIFISKLLEQPSYCYANVRRWSRKFDIFSMDKIFCPVNINNTHWTIAVIHMLDRKVQYYDSMGSSGDRYVKGLLRYLEDEHQDKKKAPLPGGSRGMDGTSSTEQAWRIVHSTTTSTPQQHNGVDCGMFSIMVADYLAYGLPLNFSQDNMPHFRQKVCADIMRGDLKYP